MLAESSIFESELLLLRLLPSHYRLLLDVGTSLNADLLHVLCNLY